MALPSNYRWVVVGNIAIRNRANSPDYAPEFSIEDLWVALNDRVRRDEYYRSYQNGSRLMWCEHVNEDDDYYHLILQVGDKDVSGVSFLHFGTLETRDIDKEEDEGSHYAAHILIGKRPDPLGRYLVLIEKVPGIYLSSVKDHFTWVCNDADYHKRVEDPQGAERSFRPVFELDGHQSKTVREALRTGVLQDIEFVALDENHDDGLDEDGIVEEVIHEARWNIKRRVSPDEASTLFGRIGGFAQQFQGPPEETKVFIRIKAENGQIKRSEVDLNGEEILEQAFVLNEVVSDFDPVLPQRYEEFRADVIEKIKAAAERVNT
ncbi:MAG: hypothetical protein AAFR90_15120 [Pseudomonadota bacterium]